MSDQKVAVRALNDLTEGPIVRQLLQFALPAMASNLLLQFYNAVDSIVIGQYAGSTALAAVGVSNPIMMLFNALFMGFSLGASIIVAQTFGAKNMEKLQRTINTTFSMAFTVGMFITIIGVVLCRPLLRLLNVPDDIIGNAALYLTIIFGGTLGNVFFNYGSGILRGMGDSRWPLVALSISCFLNIVLDIWFVYGFGWGVAGVAWATVIGQTTSGLFLAWRINNFGHGLKISFQEMLRPDMSIIKDILRYGLPSGVQQMGRSLGGVIVQSFTNSFGSVFIAANTVVMRLDGFVIMPMMALGIAATTFVGQNTGANKPDRAKTGVNRLLVMVMILAAILGVVMYFFGRQASRAFTSEDPVIAIAVQGIRVVCFSYAFMGIDATLAGALRGSGIANVSMITTIISNVFRIILVYFLAIRTSNYMGVFYSMALSMAIGAILVSAYYFLGKWRNKTRSVAESNS